MSNERTITFNVILPNHLNLTEEQIIEQYLLMEQRMNENSLLRYHLQVVVPEPVIENRQNTAVKIAVIESEVGWGRKIDDWMICQSVEDAENFRAEFNSKNLESTAPNWYMQAEGEIIPIDLTDDQMEILKLFKRCWLSIFKKI